METRVRTLENGIKRMTPVTASPKEREEVLRVHRLIEEVAPSGPGGGRLEPQQFILRAPNGHTVPIPESVFYILERVAEVLARGDAVTVVPVGKEVTTQQAADLLNVSRQYLVRLLDEGKLDCVKVGRHRRLKIEDVLAFKQRRKDERRRSLEKLVELTEDLGGYDELK